MDPDLQYGVDHSPKRRVTFQSLDEWPSENIDPSTSPLVVRGHFISSRPSVRCTYTITVLRLLGPHA